MTKGVGKGGESIIIFGRGVADCRKCYQHKMYLLYSLGEATYMHYLCNIILYGCKGARVEEIHLCVVCYIFKL